MHKRFFLTILLLILCFSLPLLAKDQIRIVGSSTVYPFSTLIAEHFNKEYPQYLTPMVESTGTGLGINNFCAGVELETPDGVNASRQIKASELELCHKNGITIQEITIGLDAIVLIKSPQLDIDDLTLKDLFLALAEYVPDSNGNLIKNPYHNWSQIRPNLPNIKIKVLGPPSTSGTREAFLTLVFDRACNSMIASGKIKLKAKEDKNRICSAIRSDDSWINAGENDSLLIRKVATTKDTLAILGYSYYKENQNMVAAVAINDIKPILPSFKNKTYPLLRPLYVYIKKEHLEFVPGLKEFTEEISSPEAIGEEGYLIKAGLIPLTK